ncbi:IS3 family transposase [Paenibacillus solisilvae]|uniref:IS3 family transposase n=1 Tax=Paenibacillus solisilvae TaxID=2486751 RepID=A0ABW0VX40_9BACL
MSEARQERDQEIKEHMMAIHFAHPYFGYPRMMNALWEAGYVVNHKKVCSRGGVENACSKWKDMGLKPPPFLTPSCCLGLLHLLSYYPFAFLSWAKSCE